MTKLCPRGKAAAKRKFKVYPSAYANAYASKICAGKIKDPSGVKRKDFKGPKPAGKKDGGRIPYRYGKSVQSNQRGKEGRVKKINKNLKKGAIKGLAGIDVPLMQAFFASGDPISLFFTLPFTDKATREAGLYKPAKTKTGTLIKGILRGAPRKIAERAALAGMSPAMAMRLARIASPIGIASLAGEGLYQVGKLGYEDQQRFNALSPEEQAAERAEQEKFAFDIEGS